MCNISVLKVIKNSCKTLLHKGIYTLKGRTGEGAGGGQFSGVMAAAGERFWCHCPGCRTCLVPLPRAPRQAAFTLRLVPMLTRV